MGSSCITPTVDEISSPPCTKKARRYVTNCLTSRFGKFYFSTSLFNGKTLHWKCCTLTFQWKEIRIFFSKNDALDWEGLSKFNDLIRDLIHKCEYCFFLFVRFSNGFKICLWYFLWYRKRERGKATINFFLLNPRLYSKDMTCHMLFYYFSLGVSLFT